MLISNGLRLIFFCLLFLAQPISFHCGRHTFATWALTKGVGIETVSKMLAHSDISMTEKYAKVLKSSVISGFHKLRNSQ